MLIRVIYDPKNAWEVNAFEVDAPDLPSALGEIDFPKELGEGDVLVHELGKGGPYHFYQLQEGKIQFIHPSVLKQDPPPCDRCGLCRTALSVKIPHTWARKWKADRPLVMVIGMAPGREEDIDRSCFVPTAPAGGILRRLVQEAGIADHEIVYSNITKCFPTGVHGEMRDPELEEMQACAPYLFEEIEELNPGVLVVAGGLAANFFLGTTGDRITQMRGRIFRAQVAGREYKVIPIIHPSALARTDNQAYADFIRDDLRLARSVAQSEVAGVELPSWHLVNDTEDAVSLLRKIQSLFKRGVIDSVALDIETNDRIKLDTDDEEFVSMALWDPQKVVLGVSVAWDDDHGYFIPLYHPQSKVDPVVFLNVFKQVFAVEFHGEPVLREPGDDPVPLTCWNGRYDQSRFYAKHGIKTKLKFDGMLASYCLFATTRKHKLKNALSEVFHWPPYEEPLLNYLRAHFKGEQAHYGQVPLEPEGETPGLAQYACYDAVGTWKLRRHFESQLDSGLRRVHDLLCELSDYLVENETRGAVIDLEYLERIEREYPVKMAALLAGLNRLPAVQRFTQKYGLYNPNSYDQVRILAFGYAVCRQCHFHSHSEEFSRMLTEKHTYCSECGARSYFTGKYWNCPNRHKVKQFTQVREPLVFDQCPKCVSLDVEKDEYLGLWPKAFSGKKNLASTGEAHLVQCLFEIARYDDQKRLRALPGKEDQAKFILDNRTYKKMGKILGYTKAIRKFLRPQSEDDMVAARLQWLMYNYLIHWTATGRIATQDFSLHTAPAKSDIRRLFVSRWKHRGGLILSADYSQLELRILACLAKDEDFRQAFREGKDIHREVASRVFKVPYDEVSAALRRYAKSCSFGIVYGESAASLAEKTGLTVQEAQDILDGIKYREFPGVGAFIEACHQEAHETGGVRTVEGRLFLLPDIKHHIPSFVSAAERQAQNYPIQSPASDLTARVCIVHNNWCKRKRLLSRSWGFVHDAVESDIFPGELMPYIHALAYHMQEAVPNSLPYIREAGVPLVAEFELATRWDGGVAVKQFGVDWMVVQGPDRFFKETIGSLYQCYPDLELEILAEDPVKRTDEIVLRRAYEGDDGGDVVITARLENLSSPQKNACRLT